MDPRGKVPFWIKAVPLIACGIAIWYQTRAGSPRVQALVMLAYCWLAMRLVARDFVHFPGWFTRLVIRIQDGKLQGKLYVFDQVRMHLYLVEDEVWVSADSVKMLLEPTEMELGLLGKGYGPIPGTKVEGLSEAALFQLIAKRKRAGAGRDTLKLENWLRNDALPNLRRLPGSSQ